MKAYTNPVNLGLGRPFNIYDLESVSIEVDLTCDHPASNYGLPVLVYEGQAYGATDLAGQEIVAAADAPVGEVRAAIRAGYPVRL